MVGIRLISILCDSQDGNGVIPDELSMVSPPSTPETLLADIFSKSIS